METTLTANDAYVFLTGHGLPAEQAIYAVGHMAIYGVPLTESYLRNWVR